MDRLIITIQESDKAQQEISSWLTARLSDNSVHVKCKTMLLMAKLDTRCPVHFQSALRESATMVVEQLTTFEAVAGSENADQDVFVRKIASSLFKRLTQPPTTDGKRHRTVFRVAIVKHRMDGAIIAQRVGDDEKLLGEPMTIGYVVPRQSTGSAMRKIEEVADYINAALVAATELRDEQMLLLAIQNADRSRDAAYFYDKFQSKWTRALDNARHVLELVQALTAENDLVIKVGMVGNCSAGKSTVLNAVVGAEVNPMGVDPTTSCIVGVRVAGSLDPSISQDVSLNKCGYRYGLGGHTCDPEFPSFTGRKGDPREGSTQAAVKNISEKIAKCNDETRTAFIQNTESKQQRAVFCWGENKNSELGMGDGADMTKILRKTEGIYPGEKVHQVACGREMSVAVTHDQTVNPATSTVMRWGKMPGMQKPADFAVPCKFKPEFQDIFITQISCGKEHVLLLGHLPKAKGQVFAFGRGREGQLGLAGPPEFVENPELISDVSQSSVHCIRQVACGGHHSLLVTEEGRARGFGKNNSFQLGVSGKKFSFAPMLLDELPDGEVIRSISCGMEHSLAITTSGNAYGFGRNKEGQLGLGKTKVIKLPQKIPDMATDGKVNKLQDVICGDNHTIAITEHILGGQRTQRLFGAGQNKHGQLGLISEDANSRPAPTLDRFQPCEFFNKAQALSVLCGENQTIVHTPGGVMIAGKQFGSRDSVMHCINDHGFEELTDKPGVCLATHSLPSHHAVCLRSDGSGAAEDLNLLLEERYRVTMPVAIDLAEGDFEALSEPEPEGCPGSQREQVAAGSAQDAQMLVQTGGLRRCDDRAYGVAGKYEFIDVPGHNEAGDLGDAAGTVQQLLVDECHMIVWVVRVGTTGENQFDSTRKMLSQSMESHQCRDCSFPKILVALTHVRIITMHHICTDYELMPMLCLRWIRSKMIMSSRQRSKCSSKKATVSFNETTFSL
eukprot:COSAG02_NODE_3710_length_6342_cov_30.226494_1_plen_957_part_00